MQGNFYNQIIDKKGLKRILSWFIENYGATRTSQLIEYFKLLGFHYATRAGLSLGFEDLKIPPMKRDLLLAAQKEVRRCENNYVRGTITAFERYQKLIDIWTTTSENLKEEVIKNFQKTPLNPLYMMAFSGARGNISQVRQLVGMRGLMSDSGGGIIDFPIRSNFREGLSVTEYVISCYGARKGLIDTALRTADSGYLTRRLVDVAHSIMVYEIDCGTSQSISVSLSEKNLLGRVLASTLRIGGSESVTGPAEGQGGRSPTSPRVLAWKNQDISATLAREIITAANGALGLLSENISGGSPRLSSTSVRVRSPLTCQSRGICQMCYGWNLAQGRFVSIGDAVGVLAAQSIGEPGTQLTMRTFHTGGIFSTDILDKVFVPHDGVIAYEKIPRGCKVRSIHGETGFFSLEPVKIRIKGVVESVLQLPAQSLIFAYPGKYVRQNDLCAEISRLQEGGNPPSTNFFQTSEVDSNPEIESEGAVKIVLSEIQGQVSFGFSTSDSIFEGSNGSLQGGNLEGISTLPPNEIWVLAGDTFFADGPVGELGDLMYWQGSRGRGLWGPQGPKVPVKGGTGFAFEDPGPPRQSFEVRGNVAVRVSEQKRVQGLHFQNKVLLGGLLRSKDSVFKNEYTSQIIRKSGRGEGPVERSPRQTKASFAVIRRVQPHLLAGGSAKPFAYRGSANLRPVGSIVYERDPVCQLLLPTQQSKTGDIVQGLPKIEQLFEGRGPSVGQGGYPSLAREAPEGHLVGAAEGPLPFLELRSQIQQRLVEEIQAVYQSQGVEIADKHVEIIVRLMTSKVRILEKGTSPFFPDDIVDLHFVQKANLPETHYEPIVLGITKVAFLTESFVSAASFQETKRVLMSSALQNRVDFLNGLKENVIVGRLIPAGTGGGAKPPF